MSRFAIAFCGYGRFARALGELAAEANLAVRAWDPAAPPPEPFRAQTPAELCGGADVVVVAVPVPAVAAALGSLRPHLSPPTLVLDVASVKVEPVAAMERVLGGAVPWVGTHPLFGPASLARGESRTVVVCPNPRHVEAAPRARSLFESLGCRVIEESPDAHDQRMAQTHAIAFFLAKAMLDAHVPVDEHAVPASFAALASVVQAVRSDAGHLLPAITRANPHAAAARRRLLDALVSVDHALAEPVGEAGDDEHADRAPMTVQALEIPDLGAHSPALRETREHIEELDHELAELLARRAELARRAARAKSALGVGIVDPARERSLLAERRAWAEELGLPADELEEVFRAVVRLSRRVQGA